jgi:hypothetical protein
VLSIDNVVKRILGEAQTEEEPEEKERPDKTPIAEPEGQASEETEIEELANLWHSGNKNDLARHFMEMNNEMSVKVVFAIGREGALELARMVDQMLETNAAPEETGDFSAPEPSTEPAAVTPPITDYPAKIMGQEKYEQRS